MLLHFVVISIFDRDTGDAQLGLKDPDLAHQAVAEQMRRLGVKPWKPYDPMWHLVRHGKFVGYVKVFRNERYARNWFRDLSEKDASSNIFAYWRDGQPLALIEGANTKDANQFVKYIAICRVRAFSAEAAQNGWKNWRSGNLTGIEIHQDKLGSGATDERAKRETTAVSQPSRQMNWKLDADIRGFFDAKAQSTEKRKATVEASEWQVTRGNSGIDGPRPNEELSRTYLFSGGAPPDTTASLIIVCKLESEGLEGGLETDKGSLRLYRQLSFYLRPFRLPHDAPFIVGLSTVDQSRGGEFDVLASPVDQETSVFARFGGRNDGCGQKVMFN
jgi:hypothetical protein